MYTVVVIIHTIVCLALILIVLLQTGRGAGLGAAFGGGASQTLFGSSGATPFLAKLTAAAAIIFHDHLPVFDLYGPSRGDLDHEGATPAPVSAPATPPSSPSGN